MMITLSIMASLCFFNHNPKVRTADAENSWVLINAEIPSFGFRV